MRRKATALEKLDISVVTPSRWLARPFDPAELAEGIQWLLKHPQPEHLRLAARDKAVSEYSMALMSERYAALYADLLQ